LSEGEPSAKSKKRLLNFAKIAGALAVLFFYIKAGAEWWNIPERGRSRISGLFAPVIIYILFVMMMNAWLKPPDGNNS
jgi:O-antigen ligase